MCLKKYCAFGFVKFNKLGTSVWEKFSEDVADEKSENQGTVNPKVTKNRECQLTAEFFNWHAGRLAWEKLPYPSL